MKFYKIFAWTNSLPKKLINNLATASVIGTRLPAPGTFGSLVGILLYLCIFEHISNNFYYILLYLPLVYLSICICHWAEIYIAKQDPGEIILDEIIAIPLCLFAIDKPNWIYLLLAFLLFRFFDILKPLGIKKLQNFKGGFGIVIDDIAAALIVCAILNIIQYFWQ